MTKLGADERLAGPKDVVLRPVIVRIDTAVRLYGFSRSDLYRRSIAGEIELLKCNGRTVIRVVDLDRLVDALPRLHPRQARPEAPAVELEYNNTPA